MMNSRKRYVVVALILIVLAVFLFVLVDATRGYCERVRVEGASLLDDRAGLLSTWSPLPNQSPNGEYLVLARGGRSLGASFSRAGLYSLEGKILQIGVTVLNEGDNRSTVVSALGKPDNTRVSQTDPSLIEEEYLYKSIGIPVVALEVT